MFDRVFGPHDGSGNSLQIDEFVKLAGYQNYRGGVMKIRSVTACIDNMDFQIRLKILCSAH
jgi:hypothetical protein